MADLNKILEQYEALKTEKQAYLPVFEVINEFVRLRKQNFISDATTDEFLTAKEVFDATAINANSTMAAALLGNMWPNGAGSVRIVKPDSLTSSTPVDEFFKNASQVLANKMDHPKARLSLALSEYMNDEGAFGTCGIAVFENKVKVKNEEGKDELAVDPDNPVIYKVWDVKTMVIDEDINGVVNVLANETQWTVRQVVQEFGYDKCADAVKKKYDNRNYLEKVKVLHAIFPRNEEEMRKGGKTNKGLPYASYHIDLDHKHLMRESGFKEMPVIVGRFYKVPGEKYGRSAAMQALPDILEINAVRESKMLATEKLLDPPLVVLDDGTLGAGEIDTSAGALNVLNVSGRIANQDPIKPLFTVGELQSTENHIEQLVQNITQAFFIDRLLDLNNDTRMTLGEAQIRNRIRGDSLTAIFDRQELEVFVPIIERTMNILLEAGLLGVISSDEEVLLRMSDKQAKVIPPEVVDLITSGREWYKIQFISPAKRMQQAEEMQGILSTMEIANAVAQYDPSVLDWINKDVMLRRATELGGGPSELINPEDVVLSVREARAEAQRLAAEQEQMRNESEVARNYAQAQQMAVQSGI